VLHNWVSVALVLPLFIVGISTFFMSHENALGQLVIGYSTEAVEIKDLLNTPDGRIYLATKSGVYQVTNNTLTPIKALSSEIRVLELLDDGRMLAAGKHGLWLNEPNVGWKKLHHGDIHGMQILSRRWYLITKEQGVLLSNDQGQSWQQELQITQLLNAMPNKRPLKLGKLMRDLHTGKALMGTHYQWIWADILALVLVILALTGIFMWWKSQKRKQMLQ
jgi:hypothetical protein